MSMTALKWVKRQRVRTTCRVVLVALADRADRAGQCWPSQATLAEETGLAVRTVRLVLAELDAAGVVARTHRGNGHGGRASDLIALSLDHDFDLLSAAEDVPDDPMIPAPDASNPEGGYRQIKVGLAAYEGEVSGTTCRGKNLPRTQKNLLPSRERRFQDEALTGTPRPAPAPYDPFGDDAFGPPDPHGEDSDAWDELEFAGGGTR
ncbi:MAG: helix-turn-helix domain-containing protein [Methylorubrum rhodinum]|uniref:helix-turn-helix domain-containing protein n=1 Tax=Methylorubrum rhodinum TaxID=29428 RepID=UPI003BB1DB98